MDKRTIVIDEEYRLVFDELNVMIERMTTIDPTKAPSFDPDKHDATPRHEWKNIGKYYATIPQAIAGLLDYKMRNGTATNLRELRDEIAGFRRHIDALMGAEGLR